MKATTRRRNSELSLGLLVVIITGGGYILVALADGPEPAARPLGASSPRCSGSTSSRTSRSAASRPNADATLLPLAALLNGIGFVTIARLDRDLARDPGRCGPRSASRVFVLTLVVVRDVRMLERYRYTFLLLGLVALLLPLAARRSAGRSTARRLWVGDRPAHLRAERDREGAARRVLRRLPRRQARAARRRAACASAAATLPVAEAPRAAAARVGRRRSWSWYEKDLGSSLLFFARVRGDALHRDRARRVPRRRRSCCSSIGACRRVPRVRPRAASASTPGSTRGRTRQGKGFQIIQALYAFGSGGIAGTGLGLGQPRPDPERGDRLRVRGDRRGARPRRHDRRSSPRSCCSSAARSASRSQAERPFAKLFAAGLATILGFQTFVIIGGVTRVIPLTGITLPFVSYGGSSLVANFVLLALLLRISDDTARQPRPSGPRGHRWAVAREQRHPARRHRGRSCCSSGSSRSSPTSRSSTPTSSPNDPHNVRGVPRATSAGPAGEIVTADGVVARPVGRRATTSSSTSACTRYGAAVRPGRRLPVDSVVGNSRRREVLRRRARRAATLDLAAAATWPTSSRASSDDRHRRADRSTPTRSGVAAAALGGQRGSVVVLDVQDRRRSSRCTRTRPSTRSPLAATTRRPCSAYFAAARRRPRPSPTCPRAWRELYPPGSTFKTVTTGVALDDGVDESRQGVPGPRRALPLPQTERDAGELRRRDVRRHARGELRRVVQHDVRPGRPRPRRAVRARHGQRFGVDDTAAASTSRPGVGRRASARSPGRSRPGQAVRSRRPRSARATVAVTPLADGARRRGGRERRRDPRAARRRPRSDDADGKTVAHDRRRRSGSTAMDAGDRGDDHASSWSQVVQRGTGTAGADPGRHGRGQDRHRGDDARAQQPHAWFIAFAPAEAPAVRGRGARRARRQPAATPRRPVAGSPRRSPRRCCSALLGT